MPASGQEINQDRSIYAPTEGTPNGDWLGRAVAIDAGVLVVGSYNYADGPADPDYGSVHLIDMETGSLIGKLFPDDGNVEQGFGRSVAIDNGIVVVGAYESGWFNRPEYRREVYVFDLASGEQLWHFKQPDTDVQTQYGLSVAIDDGVIAVGAPTFEWRDVHPLGGYVYLYDLETGAQISRFHETDNPVSLRPDVFGRAVDLENGRLAVGAPEAHGNFLWEGAVYIYSVTSGVQLQRLQPDDLGFTSHFGISLAMSGDRIAIGAPVGINSPKTSAVYIYDLLANTKVHRLENGIEGNSEKFGEAVAFDNDIVAVGSHFGTSDNGSVHMFNATTGQLAVIIEANDSSGFDRFGFSVAMQGLKMAVGAPREEHGGQGQGAVYLYHTLAGSQYAKFVATDENLSLGNFGYATAAGAGVVMVSANKNDTRGENAGAAYLFDASSGARLATYLPDAGSTNGNFGYSLDYDSAIAAVGARDDSSRGAAYIFWAFSGDRLLKIVPNDIQSGDFFGTSIGLDAQFNGGVVAVGASLEDDRGNNAGAVYLFNPFNGNQLNKLYADDAFAGDAFGNVLSVDNGLLAVGAPLDDDLGSSSGSAYIFDMATGNQLFKLLPNDGLAGDSFGSSIAIHNGIVAVGAWNRDDLGVNSGAVYLFDAATGNQLHKFLPDDGAADDRFGFSVSISNGVVLIGAYRDDLFGSNSGSAYLFGATTGNQLYKLSPFGGNAQDLFGRSVSIHSNTIGIGAIGNDQFWGFNSGAAYTFSVPADICPADLTGDRVVNFFDISAFLQAFGNNDLIADFSGDGLFNFFDISAFLQAFGAGCP